MKIVLSIVAALTVGCFAAADTINVPAGGDIQAAIDGASDGDIIQLEAGEYFPAATIDTIGKAVTLRGEVGKDDARTTVIDGQDSIRLFQCVSGEYSGTVFEQLVIKSGYSSDGGGIYMQTASPVIQACTFVGNGQSGVRGGAVYCSVGTNPVIYDCVFTQNTAYQGGALYIAHGCDPDIRGCHFEGNESANGYGAAIYCHSFSEDRPLVDCVFIGNSGGSGGTAVGIMSYGSSSIINCDFEGNGGSFGSGQSVIRVPYNARLDISGCTFTENSGGVECSECTYLVIEDSVFDNNYHAVTVLNEYAALRRCVITSNDYLIHLSSGHISIDECVISDNGDGIFPSSSSSASMSNSVVCGNGKSGSKQIGNNVNDLGGNCVSSYCVDCDEDSDGVLDPFDNCLVVHNPLQEDCDSDGIGDACSGDCDDDGIADPCEILKGALDYNENGIPDSCECLADINESSHIDAADLGLLIAAWGDASTLPQADINNDGNVDGGDLGLLILNWGPCP